MFFSCFQKMFLLVGNLGVLLLGIFLIKAFFQKKFVQRLLLFGWLCTWFFGVCVVTNGTGGLVTVVKSMLMIAYGFGVLVLLAPVLLLYKFKRLAIVFYDFFLFLKTRILLPRSNQRYLFDSLSLLKSYLRYIAKYMINFEFIPKKAHPGLRNDKLLHFSLCFSTYGGVFCMFNEIFADEIYRFSADTSDPVIIDCGSNIGLSILYFKSLYPTAKIIGFEPCPNTFEILTKNITQNNLQNVVLHNKALLDHEEKIPFYACKENPAHGGWSVIEKENKSYEQCSELIQATRLSAYITQPIDLLKIDIEGAEDAVIKDLATQDKLPLVKRIILEYHHHMVDPAKDSLASVLKCFEDNNFGYQFTVAEKPTLANKMRNTLILYVYNKNIS